MSALDDAGVTIVTATSPADLAEVAHLFQARAR
jgi:hypothetical protein